MKTKQQGFSLSERLVSAALTDATPFLLKIHRVLTLYRRGIRAGAFSREMCAELVGIHTEQEIMLQRLLQDCTNLDLATPNHLVLLWRGVWSQLGLASLGRSPNPDALLARVRPMGREINRILEEVLVSANGRVRLRDGAANDEIIALQRRSIAKTHRILGITNPAEPSWFDLQGAVNVRLRARLRDPGTTSAVSAVGR